MGRQATAAASLCPVRSLPLLFTHGPRPQTFLQAAAWPRKLFLWASEGNVRHPRARGPQTLLGSRQACRGLSVACPKPASSLHPRAPPAKRFCRPQLGPQSLPFSSHADRPAAAGSSTVRTRAAAAQALLAQHLGCPTRPPQTAASLLAQPEQRHCYFVFFFFFFFFFCFFFFCLPFSSHADRPAAVHRKCYGQHQGCRSTSLAGSAPGLSNKAPANSRQSISTARTGALLLCFLLPVASGFSDLVMLLGLLLSAAAAVIAVVGVYPGVAGHNLGIGISTFVGFSAGHS